jgi:hypothetical protein
MEAERMLHPVINQIGVDTQNEVVKEEKDCVLTTNRGNFLAEVKKNILQNTYRWANIGSMSHLDAAT